VAIEQDPLLKGTAVFSIFATRPHGARGDSFHG